MTMGRVDESIAMVKVAHEMDPLSSVLTAAFGMLLYLARRYDESVVLLREAIDLDATHFLLHFRLGLVSIQKGWRQPAIDEMETAVALSGRSTEALTGLAQAYGAAGLAAEMQAIAAELDGQAPAIRLALQPGEGARHGRRHRAGLPLARTRAPGTQSRSDRAPVGAGLRQFSIGSAVCRPPAPCRVGGLMLYGFVTGRNSCRGHHIEIGGAPEMRSIAGILG